MSVERARPWWASDGPPDDPDPAEMLERLRSARRGQQADPTSSPTAASEALAPTDAPWSDGAPSDDDGAQHLETCGICPVCSSLRLLQETRPDLVEHLAEAARHLAAAARSLLDTPTPPRPDGEPTTSPGRNPSGSRRLERIALESEDDREVPESAPDGAAGEQRGRQERVSRPRPVIRRNPE